MGGKDLYCAFQPIVGANSSGLETQVANKIQDLYDAGKPLISKDNMARLVETGKWVLNNGKIALRGLDGVEVPRSVKTRYRDTAPGALGVKRYLFFLRRFLTGSSIGYNPFFGIVPSRCEQTATTRFYLSGLLRGTQSTPTPPNRPAETFWKTIQKVQERWKTSLHYRGAQKILKVLSCLVRIMNVAALASSSLVRDGAVNEVSDLQHALALAVSSSLTVDCNERIECFTQDPAFS